MISIIITSYGGGKKLKRAIESVLHQTYVDYEVIIVDDNDPGSEARIKTEIIMQEYSYNPKVVYVKHEHNMNGAMARNTGLSFAKGEYISFLDDDDYYLHNRMEKLAKILDEDETICGVCSSVIMANAGFFIAITKPNNKFLESKELLLNQSAIGTGSNIFLRRSAIKKCGGFDESFKRYQDVEYMIRITSNQKVLFIDDPLVIKDVSDSRRPKYYNVKESLGIFCDTFSSKLDTLTDDEKYMFWNDRLTLLLSIAIYGLVLDEVHDAANALSKLRKLSDRERIVCRFYPIFRIMLKFKYLIIEHGISIINRFKKIKYKKVNDSLIKKLDCCEEITSEYFYRYL